jgi:cystathionine gamma-synthase
LCWGSPSTRRYPCEYACTLISLSGIAADVSKSVSVLLPTWKDTVGWSSRDPETLARLKTGYPRFFIHRIIDGLSERLVAYEYSIISNKGAGVNDSSPACVPPSRLAVLFPCYQNAELCRNFLLRFAPTQEQEQIRLLVFDARGLQAHRGRSAHVVDWESLELFAVVYPAHLFSQAKSFWQHTGFGISSRYAAFWLENEDFLPSKTARTVRPKKTLRLQEGTESKQTLRNRIAHLSSTNTQQVDSQDVFLYPTGMTGISNVASALQHCRPNHDKPCTTAVFG